MGCFYSLLLLALFVFIVVTMIRFFEQVTEAVDNGWWNKVFVLLAMPLTAWCFPSRVSAGRPTAVPHHEPVRGFGKVPLMPTDAPAPAPPPPPRKKPRSGVDPAAIAKLKQKMIEQGMLDDD